MLKIVVLVSLMFFVNNLWAARLSCGACGSECASACGTRRFRTCCFNYLRKKRGPEEIKFYTPIQNLKESQPRSKLPLYIEENMLLPEQLLTKMLSNGSHRYIAGDITETHYYDS